MTDRVAVPVIKYHTRATARLVFATAPKIPCFLVPAIREGVAVPVAIARARAAAVAVVVAEGEAIGVMATGTAVLVLAATSGDLAKQIGSNNHHSPFCLMPDTIKSFGKARSAWAKTLRRTSRLIRGISLAILKT